MEVYLTKYVYNPALLEFLKTKTKFAKHINYLIPGPFCRSTRKLFLQAGPEACTPFSGMEYSRY